MYKLNKKQIEVEVRLDNGVYIPVSESAIGKTYLYKIFKQYGETKALGFTYSDVQVGVDVEKVIKMNKPEIILFDRYDLYVDKYHEVINEVKEFTIIILDCKIKEIQGVEITDWCYFNLEEHRIEVFDYDNI